MTSLLTEDIYRHKNGLKHINIITSEGFSALFVVNTPVFDNSGVAHGVEHLVFRASKAFPQPETLFQLTSLTDAKINASTFAEATYFHCQSHCLQTFMLSVNYLLNGLFNPTFTAADLQCEIHDGDIRGVIYQELLGAEEADKKNTKKNKPDEVSYGGISSSIGDLSLNDLTRFHQRYYQAENITLITANADIEQITRLVALLPEQPIQSTQMKIVIDKHQKQSQHYLHKKKQKDTQESKIDKHHQKKYPQAINKLITLYHLWLKNPHYKEIDDYKETESTIEPLLTNIVTNTDISPTSFENSLIIPLVTLSNKLVEDSTIDQVVQVMIESIDIKKSVNKPVLPNLFSELYLETQNKLAKNTSENNKLTNKMLTKDVIIPSKNHAYANDKRNALWLIAIEESEKTMATIASYIISAYPIFLAPRCQGLCYATQALTIENSAYLAIYNAFDVSPKTRLKEVPLCLLRLSQDDLFIRTSLLLAKIKYCKIYQVNNNQVMNITSTDISTYLQALVNSSHPKV